MALSSAICCPWRLRRAQCRQGLLCLAKPTITMGLMPARVTAVCVCVCLCVCVCVCASKCVLLARAYSRESLIAFFTELVVRVTDTPLMLRREVYSHFLGHIKAIERCRCSPDLLVCWSEQACVWCFMYLSALYCTF